MSSPLLTLTLPIYNAEQFLRECLASIRAQKLDEIEVIAIVDGCTDGSEAILREMADARFRIVVFNRNRGVVAASNLAIAEARAPYIARMDADDLMEPERLQRQVEFLDSNPGIDVVGTWFDYIDSRGQKIRDAFPFPATHDELKRDFRVRNSIGGPTVAFRTGRMRSIGGYIEQEPYAEDLNLWLKCLAAGFKLANIPEVLHHYRESGTQLSERRKIETWRMTNLAYQRYGRQIWGDDAPDYELGAPLYRKAWKKLNQLLRGRR